MGGGGVLGVHGMVHSDIPSFDGPSLVTGMHLV